MQLSTKPAKRRRTVYGQNGDKSKWRQTQTTPTVLKTPIYSTVGCTHIWYATVKLYEKVQYSIARYA